MNKYIYSNIKLYRVALGFTQEEAQKAIGLKSPTSYINKENGKNDFTMKEGLLLAKLFNLTLSQLFEEECSLEIIIGGIKRSDINDK